MPLSLLVAWTAAQTPERTSVTPAPRAPGRNDMNAAFMLLQVHGWDIHAVRTGAAGAQRQSRQRTGNTRAPRATARPAPPAQDQPKLSGSGLGCGLSELRRVLSMVWPCWSAKSAAEPAEASLNRVG